MTTMTYKGELTVTTCWCGMAHAVPTELREYQLRQHENGGKVPDIFCPLGHAHVPAGKSQVEIEREMRQRAEMRLTATRDQLESEKRSHVATKGQLTKARKRIGKGVCPCCNRHFTNVERHMATQHPDYSEGKP